MPRMQLSDYRTWLRSRVGNPSVAEVDDSVFDDITNESYEEIANRFVFHKVRKIVTFPTIAPTVATPPVLTPRYTIPTDCLEVRSIWNTGSTANPTTQYKLEKRDEAWLAGQQTDLSNPISAAPTDYVRQRDWIELSPAPDDVYTMRLEYKAILAKLVSPTDIPALPDVWHKGIAYLARFKYWDEIRLDNPKAQWAMEVWNGWVETKPVEVEEENFADNTEGVQVLGLSNASGHSRPWSSADFDRMD